jgi:hypothetical protein
MPPPDLQKLFKTVLTDPEGLHKPTLPTTAIVRAEATGSRGNWTAVYGHSEGSTAIYGESPVYAGFFSGDVYVSDELTIGSDSKSVNKAIATIGELQTTIKGLVQTISDLERKVGSANSSGQTSFGIPVQSPVVRPTIVLTEFNPLASGGLIFRLTGNGFKRGSKVMVRVFDVSTRTQLTLANEGIISTFSQAEFFSAADGSLNASDQFQAGKGDELNFAATDGTSDPNDTSGMLWSNSIVAKVP